MKVSEKGYSYSLFTTQHFWFTDEFENYFGYLDLSEEIERIPYDFSSIIHYNSDAMQNDNNKPTLLSKFPSLLSSNGTLERKRDSFSKLDILKIQTLYGCEVIEPPRITYPMDANDLSEIEEISKRFRIETEFLGMNQTLVDTYLIKSLSTCGIGHFWDLDYPLVEKEHKHYEMVCEEKKLTGSK